MSATTWSLLPVPAGRMVRFDNFGPQYRSIKNEVDRAICRVLASGRFILGNEVALFEEEFASYIGTRYAVGVASGTEAIALSLMALDIGPGCEVITTDMTAFPTITGILQAGANPVLVDICPDSGLIDPDAIERKITKRTAAIVPVHLYGDSCDMDRIGVIARKHRLKIVEDCAQACGTTFGPRRTGNLGNCGAFSFYPTKNLGAYGDGGAITTHDERLNQKLRSLRNYGQKDRYHHERFGLNSRLDEIQAAVLRVKLKYLDKWNQKRREIADEYRRHLANAFCLAENPRTLHNYHLFVIKSPDRDRLLAHLLAHHIQCLIHYPIPVHRQPAFPFRKQGAFPVSERFAKSILSLPIYPELGGKDRQRIIKVIHDFKN